MTRRRARASRRWAIAASAIVAAVCLGLAIADAAQLPVGGNGLFLGNLARCTNGPVAITGGSTHVGSTFTSVQLSSVAAPCAGRTAQVAVYNSAGAAIATGSGTATTGSFDVATTNFPYSAVAGVAVLFDTWGVPTTWTAPVVPPFTCVATNNQWVPVVPAVNCTVTNLVVTPGTSGGFATETISFRVGNLGGNTRFILTADFGSVPTFPGWTPQRVWRLILRSDPNYDCGQLPIVSVRGRTSDGPTYYLFETLNPANINPGGYTRICP